MEAPVGTDHTYELAVGVPIVENTTLLAEQSPVEGPVITAGAPGKFNPKFFDLELLVPQAFSAFTETTPPL
jgi:hypothetical protein